MDIREVLKCKDCQVTACPICESKGIIANMQRVTDYLLKKDKFVCDTCKTEMWA